MLKQIDNMLEALAEWQAGNLHQSAIGYPTMDPVARAAAGSYMGSAPLHAISPEVMMPSHIAEADRVIRTAPIGVQGLYERHYLLRQPSPAGAYWVRLDRLHWWLAGRLGLDMWPAERAERRTPTLMPVEDGSVLTRAVEWLKHHLRSKSGSAAKRDIIESARKAGFSVRTIYRAQHELGVTYMIRSVDGERRSVWTLIEMSVPSH